MISNWRLFQNNPYITICVQNSYRHYSPISKKSKECELDERFWTAIDKIGMICFSMFLRATKLSYPISTQNRNSCQCSGAIQIHQNRRSLSSLRASRKNMASIIYDEKGFFFFSWFYETWINSYTWRTAKGWPNRCAIQKSKTL